MAGAGLDWRLVLWNHRAMENTEELKTFVFSVALWFNPFRFCSAVRKAHLQAFPYNPPLDNRPITGSSNTVLDACGLKNILP